MDKVRKAVIPKVIRVKELVSKLPTVECLIKPRPRYKICDAVVHVLWNFALVGGNHGFKAKSRQHNSDFISCRIWHVKLNRWPNAVGA
jgi:hypothetical protein